MTYQYLNVNQLKIHPKNIRLYYAEPEVREMAGSIQATGGVIQAMQVVPAETPDAYYVVDGNMRLAASRTLDDCPPLKCEILSSNEAEQLLVMLTTSHFHYPKDAISKAKHYRRLMEEEGLTPQEIADAVGLSPSSIYNAMTLLDITDPPVQQLIAEKKLPATIALYRQLARIPDPNKRLQLARRFAANGYSAKQALKSVRFVLTQYEKLADQPNPKPPKPKKILRISPNGTGLDAGKISRLAKTHLCSGCRLDGLGQKCYTCPGPYEFVNALVDHLPGAISETEGDPELIFEAAA